MAVEQAKAPDSLISEEAQEHGVKANTVPKRRRNNAGIQAAAPAPAPALRSFFMCKLPPTQCLKLVDLLQVHDIDLASLAGRDRRVFRTQCHRSGLLIAVGRRG
jgi:hypothetical protein